MATSQRILGAAFLFCLAVPGARAQSPVFAVSVSSWKLDHELTGNLLSGPAVQIFSARSKSGWMGHLGLERMTGVSPRFGGVCGGFVQPGACDPTEPIRDHTSLLLVGGGVSLQILERNRVSIAPIITAYAGGISTRSRGQVSGKSISGSGTLWGGSAGVRLGWKPWATKRIAITGSAEVGTLSALNAQSLDSYEPYSDDRFGTRHFSLGISWLGR